MILITPHITLRDEEIAEEFVRSSGAGGQNVNKVSTAVQLRFDVVHSPSLPDDVKERLIRLAGKSVNAQGVLQIKAQTFRTQERNRQDALERLTALIQQAAVRPVIRRATKPTRGSQQRRLTAKAVQSRRKQARRDIGDE